MNSHSHELSVVASSFVIGCWWVFAFVFLFCAGMLGMMIATGLAFSEPPWVVIAALLGWYGTHLRIRSEEALLKEAFGQAFEEYARKVPALIPRMGRVR